MRIEPTTHELRTWPAFFQAVWDGRKTFEVRYDDRGYQRGDTVILREWDRDAGCTCPDHRPHGSTCEKYTGRTVTAMIGHVLASMPAKGAQRAFFGNGWVVFSLCDPVTATEPVTTLANPQAESAAVAAARMSLASRNGDRP